MQQQQTHPPSVGVLSRTLNCSTARLGVSRIFSLANGIGIVGCAAGGAVGDAIALFARNALWFVLVSVCLTFLRLWVQRAVILVCGNAADVNVSRRRMKIRERGGGVEESS